MSQYSFSFSPPKKTNRRTNQVQPTNEPTNKRINERKESLLADSGDGTLPESIIRWLEKAPFRHGNLATSAVLRRPHSIESLFVCLFIRLFGINLAGRAETSSLRLAPLSRPCCFVRGGSPPQTHPATAGHDHSLPVDARRS